MTGGEMKRGSLVNSAKEAVVILFSILVAFSLDAWWKRLGLRLSKRRQHATQRCNRIPQIL